MATQALLALARRWISDADGRETLRQLRGVELTCRTRDDAEQVADLLSSAMPDPPRCRLGLLELLINAIEHGNLEIGTERKGQLLRENRLETEIASRLRREPYRSRRARLTISQVDPVIEIEIRDEGPGFAWRAALAGEIATSDQPNGRGIALVRHTCFADLEYRDPGNIAIVRLPWS